MAERYYTAEAYSELREAFDQIMSTIVEKNACYVAPVVPISRMNRAYAGDKIYLGFFKPQQSGRWIGNIKRYALESGGTLIDAGGAEVTTSDGLIKENALSWWTSLGNDGPAVEKGGVAEVLEEALEAGTARNIYTYTGTQAALSHSSNAFVTTNTAITNTTLNVANDTARLSLFTSVRTGRLETSSTRSRRSSTTRRQTRASSTSGRTTACCTPSTTSPAWRSGPSSRRNISSACGGLRTPITITLWTARR